AQGISRGVTLRLAEDGFEVAVHDVATNSANLDSLVAEIKQKGRESSKHIADVSQDEQVKAMVEEVVKAPGAVHRKQLIFFFCNGSHSYSSSFHINARELFFCYKCAGIQMIKQGRGGRIIGASSLAGKRGMYPVGPIAAYSMSRFAVRGLTQAAAQEFGSHGITVNAYGEPQDV
ncbi:hypothetical protein K438DRAFT_1609046, partial [Mycena galopus ATCC 62051]